MLIVDHEQHLPFLASYVGGPPPSSVVLREGNAFRGKVRSSSSGDGVSAARVCASWSDARVSDPLGSFRRCVSTSDDGVFTFAGLPDGRVDASIDAPGFEQYSYRFRVDGYRARTSAELATVDLERIDFSAAPELSRVPKIRVEVVGTGGEPIERYLMRVHAVDRAQVSSRWVWGGGTVSVPIGSAFTGYGTVRVSFEAKNYLRSEGMVVQLASGADIDLGTVVLGPGASLEGSLLNAGSAEPAKGCLIEVLSPGSGAVRAMLMGSSYTTVSDDQGGASGLCVGME